MIDSGAVDLVVVTVTLLYHVQEIDGDIGDSHVGFASSDDRSGGHA